MERGGADVEPRADDAPVGAAGYRPHLDGLRAVAVYLVLVFHAGSDRLAGGFVGVDVFFVLSGFLVTRLLVRDLADGGAIRFRRFYARRFRRLLPAAFVVLTITAMVYAGLASPVEIDDATDAFQAAFLYVTNWYFIDQSSDYFGIDPSSNPVLHFWSLAVEEQFYLLWPLLLGGLHLATRRLGANHWRAVRALVAAGAVASVTWALILRTRDPAHAYYGTDTRAYQLLAGAALALTPTVWHRLSRWRYAPHAVGGAGLVALLAVATSLTDSLDPIERGIATTVATAAILAALEAHPHGPLHAGLSLPVPVYLGKISYGTYLWHWPVVLVLTRTFTDLSTLSTVALTTLVATALASLSYQVLERPIRTSSWLDDHRGPVITTGLATSALAALLLIPTILDPSPTTAAPTASVDLEGFTPTPDLDYQAISDQRGTYLHCLDRPAEACTVVEGDGPHVLLTGDSHASMLVPAFKELAEEQGLRLSLSVRAGCPWQAGLFVSIFPERYDACEATRRDLVDRVIPELDPDVVVGANFPYDDPASFVHFLDEDRQPVDPEDAAELEAWVEEATAESLEAFSADGRRVVVVEPIPFPGHSFDPLECLSGADVVEECRYVARTRPSDVEALYRRLDDASDTVWSADLDRLVCPFLPICDPIVNGQVVKFDESHLTNAYSATLAPAVGDYLRENGILSDRS
jgi:peptidoglycan/LPS O-acetylase OafA/YrhL